MEKKNNGEIFPVISIEPLHQKYIIGDASLHEMHNDPDIKYILTQITDAFTEWGFVYLVDHGIESRDAFKVAKEFFEKEKTFKAQYSRTAYGGNWGYGPYKSTSIEKGRPADLKEAFTFTTLYNPPKESKEKINELINVGTQFSEECRILATMLLRVIGPSIHKGDPDVLVNKHQGMGHINTNRTTLKLLYYPSIENEDEILENQLRCGEHTDFGTITLLFQDNAGGLQVASPSGEYVDALPVPGSIVVNIGDLMEIWSSGKFKANRHRVLVRNRHATVRQSIAYFVFPDNEVELSCPDGSGNCESVNAYDYFMKRSAYWKTK